MKKRALSKSEEFDILKIVANNFMLFAIFILGLGFYRIISGLGNMGLNIIILISGIILLLLFIFLLVKEYEYIKL
jgi:membrane-bound ClpP family serine protease